MDSFYAPANGAPLQCPHRPCLAPAAAETTGNPLINIPLLHCRPRCCTIVSVDARRARAAALLALALFAYAPARGEDKVQLDPFARATGGFAACPEQPPPLLAAEAARVESHVRVERGLRCAMEGTCEPGGAYKRDPEVNERIRALIAAEARFADTSIWVTTTRKWVTLEGCVRSAAQRNALVEFVAKQRDVERVFDELSTGLPKKALQHAPTRPAIPKD